MEQSPSETVVAPSPPRKKRGRPKKADKLQRDASASASKDVPNVRQKRKKGVSKSVPVAGGRKERQQGMSPSSTKISDSDAEADAAGPVPEKDGSPSSDVNVNVGQQVHGVVDGMFDAGYLVTVRVGDTDTVFRGVVFGPGLSLPLNTENDVAPKLKRMSHDNDTHHEQIVASSAAILGEAGAEGSVAAAVSPPALQHAPANSASILASSSTPSSSEGHRAVAMAGSASGMGVPSNMPLPPSAGGSGGYSPVLPYRSPMFVQSPLQNASGGFFYAPMGHTPNPTAGNHGPAYFPPPSRGFPGAYPFQYPTRAEYHAASSQFEGPAPAAATSVSPSPNIQGTLPPRA